MQRRYLKALLGPLVLLLILMGLFYAHFCKIKCVLCAQFYAQLASLNQDAEALGEILHCVDPESVVFLAHATWPKTTLAEQIEKVGPDYVGLTLQSPGKAEARMVCV